MNNDILSNIFFTLYVSLPSSSGRFVTVAAISASNRENTDVQLFLKIRTRKQLKVGDRFITS